MPRNMVVEAANAFWFSHNHGRTAREHYFDDWTPADVHSLVNEAFSAGARWNMIETARLNPAISKFTEMLILLGVFDGEFAAANLSESTRGGAPGDQESADNR